MEIKGYYFITDTGLSKKGNLEDVTAAVCAGVRVVQYREKGLTNSIKLDEARKLQNICSGKCLFIINDDVELAVKIGADGVHVGQMDMIYSEVRVLMGKNKVVGVTVHNLEEAVAAELAGADYLGVSPVFPTTTKVDAGKPGGVELVRSIRRVVKVPIVAIGGISIGNASEVIAAGADAICAISAVVASNDVAVEIIKFQRLFK
ncbi:MAG: thiamine phosphate synthase [Elusimicrobiota bacterium]